MGFFSWKTSDTEKSISNTYSNRGALPIYLLCPNGEKLYEDNYEGYGKFKGKDAYALLAEWNAPELCNGDVAHDRIVGIDLTYKTPEKIKYPLKFVENGNLNYDDVEPSEDDEEQGFFYEEEEEDE